MTDKQFLDFIGEYTIEVCKEYFLIMSEEKKIKCKCFFGVHNMPFYINKKYLDSLPTDLKELFSYISLEEEIDFFKKFEKYFNIKNRKENENIWLCLFL